MSNTALEIARTARDVGYRFISQRLLGRQTADQVGVRLTLDHPAISDRMFYVMNRDYESRDARLAELVLNHESDVLELGASCGFMAIYCRKIIGVRNYAMVEANPDLPSLIDQNFRLNGLDPDATPLIRAAAAGADGLISFTVHRNIWSSSVVDRGGETIAVPARTLPSIIADLSFAPDTLILDIEGSELQIPAEHYALFENLVIETHAKLLPDGEERTDRLMSELAALGFKILKREGDSYVMTKR